MKRYFWVLILGLSALWGCQKDIQLLGAGKDSVKTTVYLRSIILKSFPLNDPNTGLPWDDNSIQSFDSTDSVGPDIYFNYRLKSDVLEPMYFYQTTHYQDVTALPADSPLVYVLTEPALIDSFYIDTTFYLRMYDLDFNGLINDSTLMDSIPFVIGHDDNQLYVDGTGVNGTQVTLGLEWK